MSPACFLFQSPLQWPKMLDLQLIFLPCVESKKTLIFLCIHLFPWDTDIWSLWVFQFAVQNHKNSLAAEINDCFWFGKVLKHMLTFKCMSPPLMQLLFISWNEATASLELTCFCVIFWNTHSVNKQLDFSWVSWVVQSWPEVLPVHSVKGLCSHFH